MAEKPAKKYVQVVINVSEEERDEINALARARGFGVTSDYLRLLIEQDAKAHGVEVSFGVNRGGNRRKLPRGCSIRRVSTHMIQKP